VSFETGATDTSSVSFLAVYLDQIGSAIIGPANCRAVEACEDAQETNRF
jgi:hypothetical protein